jgi:hypothetical protein
MQSPGATCARGRQMYYTFNHIDGTFSIEMKCVEVSLPEVLQNVEQFLRGCGFSFTGSLGIIDDEE